MNVLRISERQLAEVHDDLARPHAFAIERVGFIACRTATLRHGIAILAESYHPVADDGYAPDPHFGALMNASAIRAALALAYKARASMFHIHRHEHSGAPRFSPLDRRESAKFVPNFWNVVPEEPHGAIVLSYDAADSLAWWPGAATGRPLERIVCIGRSIRVLNEKSNARTIRPAELSRFRQ